MKKTVLIQLVALVFIFAGSHPVLSSSGSRNAAPAGSFPFDLRRFSIKQEYIPAGADTIGVIQSTVGHTVVLHKNTGQAYYAAENDKIYTQDVFFTLEDSSCKIRFDTRDIITLGANTKIGIDEYVNDKKNRSKNSTINLVRGKAIFYFIKLFSYRNSKARVKTATATVGIRGTKFGTMYGKADPALDGSPKPADSSQGVTTVHTFQGTVELCNVNGGNCVTLTKGESGWVDSDGNTWSGPSPDNMESDFGISKRIQKQQDQKGKNTDTTDTGVKESDDADNALDDVNTGEAIEPSKKPDHPPEPPPDQRQDPPCYP